MPVVRIPLSKEQFAQLPRQAAYKYEYLNGEAYLSPRPKYYHARLTLSEYTPLPDVESCAGVRVRRITDDDHDELLALFRSAFRRVQPYCGLNKEQFAEATRESFDKTWTGGDGPPVHDACLAVRDADRNNMIGAMFVTLLPDGPATDYDSWYWMEPPPDDIAANGGGRPHLTWVFVSPRHPARGVATKLLTRAISVLRERGYRELYSTFILGNDASTLWHWRNGFELLSHPFSLRRMQREIQQQNAARRRLGNPSSEDRSSDRS